MDSREILRNHLAKDKLRTSGEQYLHSLLRLLDAGEITDDGSYTYDDSEGHAEKFMVAGNGPTVYVVFVEFARDDVTGYLEYAGSDGTTITYIPEPIVTDLRAALRTDAKARNAR